MREPLWAFVSKFEAQSVFEDQMMIIDENHNLVRPRDLIEWGEFFESARRRVALTEINGWVVSTVFLGINHAFFGGALWFETMIFLDEDKPAPFDENERLEAWRENQQMRYATWDEAVAGHAQFVEIIREGLF